MNAFRPRLLCAVCVGLVLALADCHSDGPLAPPAGEFVLRSVRWGVDGESVVPGTFSGVGAGDSVRVVAGEFVLLPDNRWESYWDRVLVTNGVETERRTLGAAGSYRVVSRTATQTVLDLYPGEIVPASLTPTAILRGDSLFHSAFVYSR